MISKTTREKVLLKYGCCCAYCGCELTIKTLQVDHLKAKVYGGTDDAENLMPACRDCNTYKSFNGLELFRKYIKQMLGEKLNYLFKSKTKMNLAIKMGVIEVHEWDGLFYFERFEKQLK